MLAKIATAFISPLGTAILCGLFSLLAVKIGKARFKRLGFYAGVFGLAWLYTWSTPMASGTLRGWVENRSGPREVAELPEVAVIVVLGGGVRGAHPPQRPNPDLVNSADRVWHAARLYHAGKGRKIILCGGVVKAGEGSEAEAMRIFLGDLGVPVSAMVLESESTDTFTNARNTAAMLAEEGAEQILLVTSALHMPRARRIFQKAGVHVYPAPTDFEVIKSPLSWRGLIPNAGTLNGSARAMKELVGWMLAR